MANLNLWQKPNGQITGKPFGTRVSGNATISGSLSAGNANTHGVCSGTAGNLTLTVPNGWSYTGFGFVYQSQGTGVGLGEIVYINSITSTTATLKTALHNSYGTGAQIVLFNQYNNLTVNASSIPAWNGSIYGIGVLCANIVNIAGAIDGIGKGYRGGAGAAADTANYGNYGESHSAVAGNSNNTNRNAAGGGGGSNPTNAINAKGGGSGGHVNAGVGGDTPGAEDESGGQGGLGGYGDDDLVDTMVFGGAGGGGAGAHSNDTGIHPHQPGGAGGNGGGILIIIANVLTVSATASVAGGVGVDGGLTYSMPGFDGMSGGGGGGAGGSILVLCCTANIGSNLLVATGGQPGQSNATKKAIGSVGRIAIHHSSTITGTSSPTYTDVSDKTLYELNAGAIFAALL